MMATIHSVAEMSERRDALLLRETHHRCSNDLQLIVSLLALESRRAAHPEASRALGDAMERVTVLAQVRAAMQDGRNSGLVTALRLVCEALAVHAEPRGILILFRALEEDPILSNAQVSTLALVVNELTTNAIKHAFELGQSGQIRVSMTGGRSVRIVVDDDGLPFRTATAAADGGVGLSLCKRLMASIGGLLIGPGPGAKAFELRLPLTGALSVR